MKRTTLARLSSLGASTAVLSVMVAACSSGNGGASSSEGTSATESAALNINPDMRPPPCENPPPVSLPYSRACASEECVGLEWKLAFHDGNCFLSSGAEGRCNKGICGGPIQTGGGTANYFVSTILYAPPGSNGSSKSVADYSTSSSLGTSTSATSSFSNVASIGVTASGSFIGGASVGVQFDTSMSTTQSNELDVTKSASTDFKISGQVDGIDHNWDMIWLMLDPTVDVSVFADNHLEWGMTAPVGKPAAFQYVYPAWLNGMAKMPANVATTLANAGITSADYATILARDPFSPYLRICLAPGRCPPVLAPTIDPNRYILQSFTFPYEPLPAIPNATCNPLNRTLTSDTITKTSNQFSDSYGVTITASAGLDFGVLSAKLTASDKMTWTNTNTSGSSTDNKQSASLTVACASSSYTGPTLVDVYLDTLYNTFLFAFDPRSTAAIREDQARVQGTVLAPDGTPAVHEEVHLTVGNETLKTFTDSEGRYFFFHAPEGAASVSVRGVKEPIADALPTKMLHDVKL